MSKFVRSSKFRHVFGQPAKKENTYDGVKISRSAWDSNKVKANPKYVAVQWEAGGGGAIGVMNIEKTGRQPPNLPLICGHKGAILDMDFNPFNDQLIATVSEDTTVKVWQIPEEGLKANLSDPVQTMTAHRKKVGTADFNPTANNILATSSTDNCVKVWDIEKASEITSNSEFNDIIQNVSWNWNGSLAAVSCKDKQMRILDPRANTFAAQCSPHQGVKGFRACYLGKPREAIFTVGFNKTSERQYALWDPKNLEKPLTTASIDNASGLIMPFYDNDTCVMFLAGKGDGNIRYYEVTDEGQFIYYLTEYKSSQAQNGCGWVPKRGLNLDNCEIARILKASGTVVEPISFCVPRKGDQFQDDLYPPTPGAEPAVSAADWAGGQTGEPKLISLEPGKSVGTGGASFSAQAEESVADLKAKVASLEKQLAEANAKIKELQG